MSDQHDQDDDLAMLTAHEELSDDDDDEHDDAVVMQESLLPQGTAAASGNAPTEGHAVGVKELRLAAAAEDDDDDEPVVEAVLVQAEDDDDEDGSVVAAVVVDDDEDAEVDVVVPEAEVVPTPSKKRSSTGSSTKKRKKKSKKKRPKRGEDIHVSSDRLDAAAGARSMLESAVPRLPVLISDTHVVRSFGRLQLEHATDESRFCSAGALHPVGFSCERYEYSPVHGRVLKLRCSIFDGAKIKAKQETVDESIPDGPVFRVMWGHGVDDDADMVDYPYDPFVDSAYISADKVDTVAVPLTGRETDDVVPEEGMRVKVRFDHYEWYTGTITDIGDEEYDKKKRKTLYEVLIEYDDGSTEEAIFPDPDISLHLPGSEDEANEKGIIKLTEIRGKPVTSVIGASPLEAWGKALVQLGLIDEIMLKSGLEAVAAARIEGFAEAKEKLEMQKQQRQQARARVQQRQAEKEDGDAAAKEDGDSAAKEESAPEEISDQQPPEPDTAEPAATEVVRGDSGEASVQESQELPSVAANDDDHKAQDAQEEQEETPDGGLVESESPCIEELELRKKVDSLREELELLQAHDRQASVALADARINALGTLLNNPFCEAEPDSSQQASWLATVVRKEKSKMGSTGNKRKVVGVTDLLERNDTFFNGDIEALVEGLPGSEFCHSYVFGVLRAGGAAAVNQAWVHEARIRQERDRDKQRRSAKEAKMKDSQNRERELKRKRRDEERDERKKRKLEEEEQKKKARAEERMSRLNVQVGDRLFKEASFQREKVILLMAKTLTKEYGRRRKAAELVAGQAVVLERSNGIGESNLHTHRELPPLSRRYDEDVLRLWDFLSSFGSSFLEWGYFEKIPSLDSLQNAIDALRSEESSLARAEALDSLIEIAVALCQPLGASLTKLLFASLVALNPALQKDFGAAFFAGVNKSTNTKDDSPEASSTALLPVNPATWKEIARLAFLSDALIELGYSRQETAHLLRGYRSGGHPNSKEAKRLRRVEEFAVSVLRQLIANDTSADSPEFSSGGRHKIRIPVPCNPSCCSADWIFYLHNVKLLSPSATKEIKKNIQKALTILKSSEKISESSFVSDLEKSLSMYDKLGSGENSAVSAKANSDEARLIVLRVLDRATDEHCATDGSGRIVVREQVVAGRDGAKACVAFHHLQRQRMGHLKSLLVTRKEYKGIEHDKEEYMSDALRLKEEMERKQIDDEEEDDDDDDDDDADVNEKESTKVQHTPDAKEVSTNSQDIMSERVMTKCNGSSAGQEEKKAVDETSNGSSAFAESVEENGTTGVDTTNEEGKIGKPTPYDEFCGDRPNAPELIRRCLAVLRTLCQSGPAEPFIYPVDPQTNPGYYESVLRPMCLREAGRQLLHSAKLFAGETDNAKELTSRVEAVVAEFGRNIRLISKNCSCYANAGPMVVSAGEELVRIFERLFLDWVLAPEHLLPPLEYLDDERCVEYHESDEDSMVLLCDGCEGKYNMSRLYPPLLEVPKGDWFCPRCIDGRCWEDLDPRVGKRVNRKDAFDETAIPKSNDRIQSCLGTVHRCQLHYPEGPDTKPSLLYVIRYDDDSEETWSLSQVDKALASTGEDVDPIRCLEAVAESPGYGLGIDRGLYGDLVPALLNPRVAEMASQAILSSSVFRDTILGSTSLLLIRPEEMTASEWLRLLVLLITKCSSSEIMQSLASEMENEAAEIQASRLSEAKRIEDVSDLFPRDSDDESLISIVEMNVASGIGASGTLADVPVESTASSSAGFPGDVVEAAEIEVVADVAPEPTDTANVQASAKPVEATEATLPNTLQTCERKEALEARQTRQKSREDSIAAYCIKQQLLPTVSSFDEDAVSQVVDSTFSLEDPGLSYGACRCRNVQCDFCGLSDTALGAPLVRVPSRKEWNALMRHSSHARRSFLVANVGNHEESIVGTPSKLIAVSVRVDGELISARGSSASFDDVEDGGMTEYLPRNARGFQAELEFRSDSGLPFVTGSLSAHECCAVATHRARKERLIQDYVEKQEVLAEREAGITCGRTLWLGKDELGRSYWKFNGDASLFVSEQGASLAVQNQETQKLWHRFSEPEDIASVVYTLGRDDIVAELKRVFPVSAGMLRNKQWTEILMKRRSPLSQSPSQETAPQTDAGQSASQEQDPDGVQQNDAGEDEPYEEGEHVLVEAKNEKLLWDAVVIGVARATSKQKVTGYRVHYKKWSSRFDEWVEPYRVVEPSENNIEVQEELLEELAICPGGIPTSLEKMAAKDFIHIKKRTRGLSALPNFAEAAKVGPSATSEEKVFATTKAALLLIESALPLGAVDNSETGPWRADLASKWRRLVLDAAGPSSLMRCTILLEDSIHPDWMGLQYSHLLSCMPLRWKAIKEASVSSLALRISLIDRGLKYAHTDAT